MVIKKILLLLAVICITAVATAQTKSLQEKLGYPKNAKLLILHADDVGVSHSENAATIKSLESTSVNSASIMVPCPWFPEIAAYAQTHPAADLGLHITLTSEWKYYKWGPVTPASKIPGLVNKQGFLYSTTDSVRRFATAAEVEEETRNQVKRAIQFGIDPTHLDAHMFAAISKPDFLQAYLKVGREFRIPVFMHRGMEKEFNIKFGSFLTDKEVVMDTVITILPEDFTGDTKPYYINRLKNLKPGISYFIIHTAYDTEEMRSITTGFTEWGSEWRQREFNFFAGPECAKLLKENNIYLVTWREIRDKITRN